MKKHYKTGRSSESVYDRGKLSRKLISADTPEVRPRILRGLAAALMAASFLDPLKVSPIPFMHNIGSIIGMMLLISFILLRLYRSRFLTNTSRYIVFFVVITTSVELLRMIISGSPESATAFREYLQYAQVMVLFLIMYDLAQDPRTIRMVGLAFVFSTFAMSLAANLHIQGLTRYGKEDRYGMIGINFNAQALLYALAILMIICWVMARWKEIHVGDILFSLTTLSMMAAMVKTGSRGATAVLMIGIATLMFLYRKGGRFSAYFTILPVLLVTMAMIFLRADVLQQRIETTIETGDTSLRLEIAESGTQMFLERPLVGYGAQYSRSLGEYMQKGRRLAAHNLYIQMLLAFGLAGFIPWLITIIIALRDAWRFRSSPWGGMMLTMTVAVVTAGATAHLGHEKIFYVILAFAMRSRVLYFQPVTLFGKVDSYVKRTGAQSELLRFLPRKI